MSKLLQQFSFATQETLTDLANRSPLRCFLKEVIGITYKLTVKNRNNTAIVEEDDWNIKGLIYCKFDIIVPYLRDASTQFKKVNLY